MANRTIIFTVNSTPQGAAIYIDGNNTFNVTPHTLQYLESELLSPKTITVKNGNSSANESYILKAELINSNNTGGGSGGGGGSYGGGGYGGGNTSNSYIENYL